jgi:preprotein translocase subunit SecA
MNFITKTLTRLFGGNKYEKDIRDVQPLVARTNEEFAKLQSLSHDALRAKTAEFRVRIAEFLRPIDSQSEAIRQRMSEQPDMDPEEKETLYQQLDDLSKERATKGEDILKQLLPEAFAVVKETARRFKENEEIVA